VNRGYAIAGLVVVGVVGVGVAAATAITLGVIVMSERHTLAIVRQITADQAVNAARIVEAAYRAGLPATIAGALVANAWAESRLDARALGERDPSGVYHAAGLFQLNDARPSAMGYGMSLASRQDPDVNIAKFLSALLSSQGAAVRDAADQGASMAELAGLISRDLERPQNEGAEMVARSGYARTLFGAAADARGSRLDYTG
jgi:hypothetical protein